MTIERVLKGGLNVRVPVRGSSMFPLLSTGDSVIVTSPDNLKEGDIILFRDRENLVCHRLVRIINQEGEVYYITRGDALFSTDRPVMAKDVIGKVIDVERKRVSLPRRVFLFFNPLGWKAMKWKDLNRKMMNLAIKASALMFISISVLQGFLRFRR